MVNFSEFVSRSHPDRLADDLAAALIRDIVSHDKENGHAAVEVFLTKDHVIFGGEITTTLKITKRYLRSLVDRVFKDNGYLPEARKYWSKDEVRLAKDTKIVNMMTAQSPDIALGTTNRAGKTGWNDQGVFYSSSDNTTSTRVGYAMQLATDIGELLHDYSRESIESGWDFVLGPDIKVVAAVNVRSDGLTPVSIHSLTIAVPHTRDKDHSNVYNFVDDMVRHYLDNSDYVPLAEDFKLIVNGTGRYVKHGYSADCSMTGRKISVNHPSAGPIGLNKNIGGGSLVKNYHQASDFILNVASRFVANVVVASGLSNYAVVGSACAIGQRELQSLFIRGDSAFNHSYQKRVVAFFLKSLEWSPMGFVRLFNMFEPSFCYDLVVGNNFFGHGECQPWENPALIAEWANKLCTFLDVPTDTRVKS